MPQALPRNVDQDRKAMLMSAPLPPPEINPARAGVYVLGIGVAISSLFAGSLCAWAVGAAPQNVAHHLAILCLGCAASLLSLLAGITGLFPRNFDRLALVTNWLTAAPGVAIFFTNPLWAHARGVRRRLGRMKP